MAYVYKGTGRDTLHLQEPPIATLERPVETPKPATKRRQRKDADICGTRSGYQRHRRRRENVCQPCRAAYNTYMNTYRIQHGISIIRPIPPAGEYESGYCGNPSGYRRHLRANTTPCQSCRDAWAAYVHSYRKAAK